jgi:hypothetical protein
MCRLQSFDEPDVMWPGWWVDERVIFGIVGGSGYVNVYFWEGLSLGGKTPFEKV